MGITNINNGQNASRSTCNAQGVSRGFARPSGDIPKVGCGCNSGGNSFITWGSYVTLNLQKYVNLVNPPPRKTVKPAKPVQLKSSKTATTKKKPWYIRVFESINWTPGPKY